MDFYSSIARYYDKIFPIEDNQIRFVESRLPKNRIGFLDIGWGTGNFVLRFSRYFQRSIGIDLDEELLSIAMNKNRQADISLLKMNMLRIDTIPGTFSLITCLGNTIPHLSSLSDIGSFIDKTFHRLEKKGVLIIQIINFDRILDHRVRTLPAIETDEVLFERRYSTIKNNGKLDFETMLTDKKSEQTISNSIELFPIRKDELARILNDSGFGTFEIFGSFDGAPYSSDSFLLIAVCTNSLA
jgi:glycine/sarcosine N-methyltransferase